MTNRHDSSDGSEAAWNASNQELDPHVEIILSLRFGHKMIYMDILLLPGIHESSCHPLEKDKKVHKVLAHYLIEACLRTVKIAGPA